MQDDEAEPTVRTAERQKQNGNRRPDRLAVALVGMVLLGLAPAPASADVLGDAPTPAFEVGTDVAPTGPTCIKTRDDSGMGGTHLSCKYNCPANAVLSIGVWAHDADATAYGDTDCGDTSAPCAGGESNVCTGASQGLTARRQENARCRGNSDEFWDSPVTVSCAAVGADPRTACELLPRLPQCEHSDDPAALLQSPPAEDGGDDGGSGNGSSRDDDGSGGNVLPLRDAKDPDDPSPLEVCLEEDPGLAALGEAVLAFLFPGGGSQDMVGAHSDGEGGVWVLVQDGICSTGSI